VPVNVMPSVAMPKCWREMFGLMLVRVAAIRRRIDDEGMGLERPLFVALVQDSE